MLVDAFVINLDRVPERYEFVQREFAKAGLNVTRWAAVDAALLSSEDCPHYQPGRGTKWKLSNSLIACFESHRRVWKHVVENNIDLAFIFEDDVLLTKEAGQFFEQISAVPPEFDILKMDTTFQIRRFARPEPLFAGFEVCDIVQQIASAAAYAVSAAGARALLSASETYSDHLDDFVFTPRSGWKVRQITPAVACQGMFLSLANQKTNAPDIVLSSERTGNAELNPSLGSEPLRRKLKRSLARESANLHWALAGKARFQAAGGWVDKVQLSSPIVGAGP